MIVSKRLLQMTFVAVVVGLVGLSGCAPPEKPKELTELERILQEEGASEVQDQPGARKFYEKARKLREAALDVLEDDHDAERARHYAIRGKIAYRTAEAVAQQVEAKKRLEKADAKVQKINPRVEKLAKRRGDLRTEVQQLHREVQKAQAAKAAERRKQIEAKSSSDRDNRELEAQNKIESAIEAKRNALDANANQYAKGEFNRAANELQSARSMMDSESFGDAVSTAESARRLFVKAAKTAEEQNPKQRMRDLRDQLASSFGSGRIESVNRGVRVIMPGLFDEGSATVLRSKRNELEALAKLANEYADFQLRIDGYTSKGNPTDNLATSQLRAKNVGDFFKSQGVSGDRISTDGKGQSNPRFSSSSKNERVEVTFVRGS